MNSISNEVSLEEMLEIAKDVPVWKRSSLFQSTTYNGRSRNHNSNIFIARVKDKEKGTNAIKMYYLAGLFSGPGRRHIVKAASGDDAKSLYEIADKAYGQQRFFKLLPPKEESDVEALPWYRRIGR